MIQNRDDDVARDETNLDADNEALIGSQFGPKLMAMDAGLGFQKFFRPETSHVIFGWWKNREWNFVQGHDECYKQMNRM